VDKRGMRNVAHKNDTQRTATAQASVRMHETTLQLVRAKRQKVIHFPMRALPPLLRRRKHRTLSPIVTRF
jgi:hypothetical protein